MNVINNQEHVMAHVQNLVQAVVVADESNSNVIYYSNSGRGNMNAASEVVEGLWMWCVISFTSLIFLWRWKKQNQTDAMSSVLLDIVIHGGTAFTKD